MQNNSTKKRVLTALAASLMAISALSSCGGGNSSSTVSSQSAGSSSDSLASADSSASGGGSKKLDKPVTVTFFWREGGDIQVPEKCFLTDKILEDLNIKYVHITPVGVTSEEKLQTLLAVGDDPDIIDSYTAQTTNLINYNAIIPLDDYINEETLGNVINNQRNWDTAISLEKRSDGKTWAIPVTFGNFGDAVPYIRYDWLKEQNLSVPTTMEELKSTLIAFTNRPNAVKGTYGSSYGGLMNGLVTNFGAGWSTWYVAENGTAESGLMSSRYNDYVKFFRSLVTDGACNPEVADPGELGDNVSNNLKLNKLGFSFGWHNPSDADDLRKNIDPNADWRPMPAPKGVYDQGYLPSGSILRQEYVISAKCKEEGRLDAALLLLNYMAEDGGYKGSPDTIDFDAPYWESNYGERGVNWDIIDGKFDNAGVYNEQIKINNQGKDYLGRCRRFRTIANAAALTNAMREDQKAAQQEVDTYPLAINIPYGSGAPIYAEGVEFSQESVLFEKQMDPLVSAFFMKAILGTADIDQGIEELRSQAKAFGYEAISSQVTQQFKELGKLK